MVKITNAATGVGETLFLHALLTFAIIAIVIVIIASIAVKVQKKPLPKGVAPLLTAYALVIFAAPLFIGAYVMGHSEERMAIESRNVANIEASYGVTFPQQAQDARQRSPEPVFPVADGSLVVENVILVNSRTVLDRVLVQREADHNLSSKRLDPLHFACVPDASKSIQVC